MTDGTGIEKEVKRRADVVGILPNEGSIIRLIDAVLLEANDEWATQNRSLGLEPFGGLSALAEKEPALLATPAGPAHLTPAAA